MHWNSTVFFIFMCTILTVFANQDLYEQKCKRNCNTMLGSLDCWEETTDGFSYGLATSMVNFCQVILKIRDFSNDKESWYNISRDILSQQLKQYDLVAGVQQLNKSDIETIAVALLDSCFNSSSSITSYEPSCPSCSEIQINLIKQWRLLSITLASIGLFLAVMSFLIYTQYTYRSRRFYVLI